MDIVDQNETPKSFIFQTIDRSVDKNVEMAPIGSKNSVVWQIIPNC